MFEAPPPVSTTDSGSNDREEIEKYVEALKKRALESNREGGTGSRTQDKSVIPRRLELWTLPVPVHSSMLYS